MCGIVAQVGGESFQFVIDGLKVLSNRGYDSQGCLITYKDKPPYTIKLINGETIDCLPKDTNIAIGHNRWATHGMVNLDNTHPVHYEGFYVAHNGIVSGINIPELTSDTIYLAKTLSEFYAKESHIDVAIEKALKSLNSVGACVIWNINYPDNVWLWSDQCGQNLYVKGNRVASEPILDNMERIPYRKLIQLRSTANSDPDNESINIKTTTTLEEIESIPDYIRSHEFPDSIISTRDTVNIIGCGSSYYAGMLAAYDFNLYGVRTRCSYPDINLVNYNDLNIVVSQSGNTKDILDLLTDIELWSDIVIVHNNDDSEMERLAINNGWKSFNIGAGPEYGVAATKTFVGSALTLASLRHKIDSYAKERIAENYCTLHSQKLMIYNNIKYSPGKKIFIAGSGSDFAFASEIALKLKEVALIDAEAIETNQIKHGPIALAEDSIFIFLRRGVDDDVYNQVQSKGGKAIFTNMSGWQNLRTFQELAITIALDKGLNPDRPHHLSKVITV